jgi:hypothetical protein
MQALIAFVAAVLEAEAAVVGVELVPPAGALVAGVLAPAALLLLLPLLLPQPEMTSAMAATPAIATLVREPRTIFVPSSTGGIPTPALSYLRHAI